MSENPWTEKLAQMVKEIADMEEVQALGVLLFMSLSDALIKKGLLERYEIVDAIAERAEQMGAPECARLYQIKADLLSGVEPIPPQDRLRASSLLEDIQRCAKG